MAVDLDEAVINMRVITNEPVGGYQTAKTMPEGRTRREVFRFIDQYAADMQVLVQQTAQFFQHLFIGKFLAAGQDNFPRLEKKSRFDNAFKHAIGSNPFI